jgi:DNA-binding transcriptional regulator YdaS (Cro superfamily)
MLDSITRERTLTRPNWNKGVKLAISAAGGQRKLAAMLGISRQTIEMWKNVPVQHVVTIERLTGVPREQLRPELYRKA